MMDNFDRVVTVPDVRRADLEKFFAEPENLGTLFLDKYAVSHTSGSQGQPLLIVQSKENLELLFALQASRGNHERLGLGDVAKHLGSPARLAAVTLKPGFYPSASAFEYMPEGARAIHRAAAGVECRRGHDRAAGRVPADASHLVRQHSA